MNLSTIVAGNALPALSLPLIPTAQVLTASDPLLVSLVCGISVVDDPVMKRMGRYGYLSAKKPFSMHL